MRTSSALLVLPLWLASTVAHAQWSDDPIENSRTERRVARDAAFVGAVVGTVGALIGVPLLIATALDEPSPDMPREPILCMPFVPCPTSAETYAADRARWDVQLVASAIAVGISVAALTISIVTLALVPSPDDPVRAAVRVGPGSLSLVGTF